MNRRAQGGSRGVNRRARGAGSYLAGAGAAGSAQHSQQDVGQQAEQDEQDDHQPGRHRAQYVGEDEKQPLVLQEGPGGGEGSGGFLTLRKKHSKTTDSSMSERCQPQGPQPWSCGETATGLILPTSNQRNHGRK